MDIENGVRLMLGGLGGDKFALVSPEDFERVSKYHWIAHGINKGRYIYAVRYEIYRDDAGKKRQRRFYLHRDLLSAPKGLLVDHANRDTLDNRRCNIRLATAAQNCVNRGVRRPRSGYWNVYQRTPGRYSVIFTHRGQIIHGGIFDNPVEAAKARDVIALRLNGEFARLNFPTIPEAAK